MRNIITIIIIFICSLTVYSQDEFDSYGFKTPTLYADLGLYCGAGYVRVIEINNGGYYLKRVGIIYCDDDCSGYLPIDNPFSTQVQYTSGIIYSGFYDDLTNMVENIRYWYRGFVENNYGIYYNYTSQMLSPLCDVTPPTVKTCSGSPQYITQTSAQICGQVTSEGGSTLESWGICYNTSGNPTTASRTAAGGANPFFGFISNLSGLTAGTTYYYRAYASNSGATAYGAEYSFTTAQSLTVPTITTNSISSITENSAYSGGTIISSGNSYIVDKGLMYSVNSNFAPPILSVPGGEGISNFSLQMTLLSPCTTYYVKAYAANSSGTGYGGVSSFTTNCTCSLPTFSTAYCGNATSTSIDVGATVYSDGNCAVTSRGFSYSTDPTFSTIIATVNMGSGTGSYSTTVSNLQCGTTYYFRHFATNSVGTYYAESLIGSGCMTVKHQEYPTAPAMYYYIDNSSCFTGNFTSSFNQACQIKSNYFNSNCGQNQNFLGIVFRTVDGNISVGTKLYTYSGCEYSNTGYWLNNNLDVVYMVNGVIQSITNCP